MQRVNLDGVNLEYDVQGSGEPLLLIHGSIVANAFFPLLAESRLTSNHRVISYHRRGFAGSARARDPFTMGQQAADGRALLRHLGIPRVHVAGHSYGAAIAMQWALDAPEEVRSLALLEPPLMDWIPSGPAYWEWIASVREMYERGEKAEVTDAFLTGVAGPDYRQVLDKVLPSGAFELAVADIDTFFQVELPELQQWRFTAEEAKRLRSPVLAVVGSETAPIFSEGHALLKQWMPHAEELVVPQATHALQLMNPDAVADGLAHFFARHKL
jgi:pimeloyl-ACP methyl ester carboxylesterase